MSALKRLFQIAAFSKSSDHIDVTEIESTGGEFVSEPAVSIDDIVSASDEDVQDQSEASK